MLEKPQSRNGAIKRHPNVTAAAGFNSRRNFYGDGIFSGEKRQAVNKHSARVCELIRSSKLGARPGGRKWVLDGRMVGQWLRPPPLPPSLSLSVKVIREMFMPQPSPTSHHHFMLSSSFLLPACICRHLLCGGIVVQVTAVHLIREMFMPGLLGGLHCLHCLQYNLPILPPHHRAAGLVSHHLSKQSVLQSSSPNLGICKCTNSENMQRSLWEITSLNLQSAPEI